jgi:hypothetical protein
MKQVDHNLCIRKETSKTATTSITHEILVVDRKNYNL